MSESPHVFNLPSTASSSTENFHGVGNQPPVLAEGIRRRQQSQQQRQLLSCTKCRERKVKCDRTKPCSACCARGAPKDCHFVAEGGDYAPIQQSYELRKLRAENLRLKERLRACKIPIEDDDSSLAASPDPQLGERPASSSHRRRAARQRRFQGSEWSDSIYFGSPGLANVITDFASMNLAPMSTQSLAHLMPRGPEMYTTKSPPPHPFATLFNAKPEECIPELLSCLPARDELLACLNFFEKRVHICAFPHVPVEITKSEVERFLSDARKNAQMCPDMLALLFAALALGSQHSAWDKSGGEWKADVMNEELQKGNVYIAAAMQALRMASFMHKPTLLGIQALIMIGPYLTNSGRFLDAWTLFGTTIRLAHSIGLHRHPKFLDPAPPTQREISIRQTLWWWMLHMDQEYSMTLGRPLGISGIGDCPPPHELTTDPRMLRFGEFVNYFTVLARQILSSDRLTNTKIDEFTDLLRTLLDTMPETLQFGESWLDESQEIPEWPLGAMAAVFYCKAHTYLILLNRQRIDKQSGPPASDQTPFPPTRSQQSVHSSQAPASSQPSPTSSKPSLRGRALVLSSSVDLLTAFVFFYKRAPAALICWTMGQQAFNSCMILLLDAMETADVSRLFKVEQAYVVFQQLVKNGVHQLASLAVDRISWGLVRLGRERPQPDAKSMVSAGDRDLDCDVEMQGAARSEAMQGFGIMRDTVMGNTGMLLLEDPGLQSFVPEAFAPLTWSMAGGDFESTGSTPMQVKEEGGQKQGEPIPFDDRKKELWDRGVRDPRSSERVQAAQGSSPGSAPLQYATFSTAPSQEPAQPQGLTSPTSPSTSTAPMHEQCHQRTGAQRISTTLLQPPPPHLRHHSYPSLLHPAPTPVAPQEACPNEGMHQGQDVNASLLSGRESRVSESWDGGLTAAHVEQLLPLFATTRAPFLVRPDYASTASTRRPTQPTGNPNVHPSWAARPAAPMSTISEPALSYSHVSHRAQAIPVLPQQPLQRHAPSVSWQCSLPFHFSSAGPETTHGGAVLPGSEAKQMEMDRWRRSLGSH